MADMIGKDYKLPKSYDNKPTAYQKFMEFLTKPNTDFIENRMFWTVRNKLDRRKENKAVRANRRIEGRRPSDIEPNAICARVILRALYEKGDMETFRSYWKTCRHLFNGEMK